MGLVLMSTDLSYPVIIQNMTQQIGVRRAILEQFVSSVYQTDDSVTFLYKREFLNLPAAWNGPVISGGTVATYNDAVARYSQAFQRFCMVFGFPTK